MRCGWQREDAEGKSRGLMTLMAGFMLVAIAQSKNLFGLYKIGGNLIGWDYKDII